MSTLRLASRIVTRGWQTQVPKRWNHHHNRTVALTPEAIKALDNWEANPPTLGFSDSLSLDHLSDLYVTLPTRDGTRKPFEEPQNGAPLAQGQHLAFFHARTPEHRLRGDGTDEEISPPAPFLTRMWAGGKMTWDVENPLIVGVKSRSSATLSHLLRKGFERNKPLVFVTQKIQFFKEGKTTPSVVEERQHVYIPDGLSVVRKEPRIVPDIPQTSDFTFQYQPTPVTLFRFSAIMFNAHHIHLDKDYTTRVEGYPERLVHGPMTAMMLLETVGFHYPMAHIKEFEYRATNPMYVNRKLTIHGAWLDESVAKIWCVDDEGAVGMVGKITLAK
ncbi:hypothetical protein FA15DRAFT_580890 [Coprinopsis marcescibilis]|uniref:Thioesterase/thiol ester dehydrase-isomerase n=1 Tax=Coprinopsis marcescibilis TaxID=230819 RepID=A0A5C3LAA9_COPMA|nr:hypothetical protein FA15DRAFT_580890 [Coprinopsis marcescibilis]